MVYFGNTKLTDTPSFEKCNSTVSVLATSEYFAK